MKERVKQSGNTLYDEQIKDAQDILLFGFTDDVSYNPNIVVYNTEEQVPIKIYDQKYSASYGFTAKFLTLHDVNMPLGQLLYDKNKNDYWLCVESYDVSGIHNNGKLGKCNRFLKWQDKNGVIQKTPIIVTSASKYNNGEDGTAIIQLGSDQLLLFMQLNEDTVKLDRGMQFFIDENKDDPSVYELTRTDTALYTYNGIGFLSMIVTECAYSPTDKELELGVCNYKEPLSSAQPTEPNETLVLYAVISGKEELRLDYKKKYTVSFTDKNTGNSINWNEVSFTWRVISDFAVVQNSYDNIIELSVDNEDFVGSSFLLQCLVQDTIVGQMKITVIDGW